MTLHDFMEMRKGLFQTGFCSRVTHEIDQQDRPDRVAVSCLCSDLSCFHFLYNFLCVHLHLLSRTFTFLPLFYVLHNFLNLHLHTHHVALPTPTRSPLLPGGLKTRQ